MALNLPQLEVSKTLADLVRQLNGWRSVFNTIGFPALRRGAEIVVTVTSGSNTVTHGLRAKPLGWLVLRVEAGTPVAVCETASTDSTLTLNASGSATLTLWVYVLWPSRNS